MSGFRRQSPELGQELNVHRMGSLLSRRRWTIVACMISVVIFTFALTYLWPRTFTSTATVLVEPPDRRETPALEVLQRLGQGSPLVTELELLESDRVLGPVVDGLDLHVAAEVAGEPRRAADLFTAFEADRDALPIVLTFDTDEAGAYSIRDSGADTLVAQAAPGSALQIAGLSLVLPTAPLEGPMTVSVAPFSAAVANARARVTASLAHRDANLVRLQCEAPTALGAQELCDAVVDSYVQLRAGFQRLEATNTAAFLRGQTSRLGEQLVSIEDSLEQYSERNGIVAVDEQVVAAAQQYSQLIGEYEELDTERRALANLIQVLDQDRDVASFPTLLEDPVSTQLLTNLISLEGRRSDLALTRAEGSPEVAVLDARIAELEQQVRSRAQSYLLALDAQSESYRSAIANLAGRLGTLPAQQVALARMERSRTSLEDLYQTLSTRLREAEIAEAVDLPSVSIVDRATLPLEPSSPKLPINLGLGLVLGTAFGLVMSLVQEHSDTRIHDREELEGQTSLPIIGMIPPVPVARRSRSADSRHREFLHHPEQEVAREAFRSLGVDLQLVRTGYRENLPPTLAITSAGPGEGKTFTACNLARMRDADGYRTLVIDADIRANGVARTFRLSPTAPGLSEVLSGEVPLEAALVQVGSLWVLPAGKAPNRTIGSIESSRFRELLGALRDFDLVIIDTPPMNVLADAVNVATLVDGVLLVVRGGVTDRNALMLTLDRLERIGTRMHGIVLNDVELPTRYASYGYGQDNLVSRESQTETAR